MARIQVPIKHGARLGMLVSPPSIVLQTIFQPLWPSKDDQRVLESTQL